jgi:gliding motility-associated-like protein
LGNDTAYCGSFSRVLRTGVVNTVWSTGVTAAQITVTQPGTYIASITNTCGTKRDTIVITQNAIPTINLGRDTSICQGNSLTLSATTAGATYQWSTGASSATISVNQAGSYWVRVTNNGCSASDTIQVGILTPPASFTLGNDTAYCGSFSRVLRTGVANTVWSTGVTAAQITVTQPGTYIASITNTCGTKRDTIVITQNAIPTINLGRDTSICQGNSLTLSATTAGATYQWSTGASSATITVNQAGSYWVRVTNNGCSASDTIQVGILTPPASFTLGNDIAFCSDFSTTLSTGNTNTVWSTGVTAAQITVTTAGTYIAAISNQCGTVRDTIAVIQQSVPEVRIQGDTIICIGEEIQLTAITDQTSFIWNNGEQSSSIRIQEAGIYWVRAGSENCFATDTILVQECEGDLWVPNAFTPNGDGVNDIFRVFGKNVLEYTIMVFNRWGEKVFESNDITVHWDGVFKGKPVQVDTYVWLIKYKVRVKGEVQDKMKKGTVTVLK